MSILGSIFKGALNFIPGIGPALSAGASALGGVLGGAAKGTQDQKNFQNSQALDWEKLKLAAPEQRSNTALKAALAKNFTPQTMQWGGPGSGLRGEMPTYSGGLPASMTSAQQDPMLMQMLKDAIAGKSPDYSQYQNPKSSIWDKILGGVGLGSSVLGGIGSVLNAGKKG